MQTLHEASEPNGSRSNGRHLARVESIPASILLVDDAPANLTALEAVLEPLDARLVRANSGEEALWKILAEEFALVLLDVQMPGMDGFRVASMIRARPSTSTLPIIFLTALSREPSHVFKGYEHGAVDYIVKPFDPSVLRSKVSVFLDLYRKTKLIEQQAEALRLKERQELERRNEHRFRGVTESVADCIWAARPSGAFYYANRNARQCSPRPAGDSFSLLEAVHPEDSTELERLWSHALNAGEPFELECRMRHSEEDWRWHITRGVPECDEDGRILGWIVSATDIHRRKQAEETLVAAEQQLRLANEAKDAFLAAASHELRSPLSILKAQAQLAVRRLGNDTSDFPGKAFALIDRQVDRMARLVEELLDVSRIQHGRLSLEPEQFDLADLAFEVSERMQMTASAHEIRCEVPRGTFLTADRGRLDQVLTNLLTNAIRYSPGGGEILVGGEALGHEVRFFVRDRGIGIPPENHRTIFERFGRAHGSRYGGLGLGLTITEGIVLQHGGRIWVESEGEHGKGSTFYVQLPRSIDSEVLTTDGMAAEANANAVA